MNTMNNKKVLLIAPSFYGYEKEIQLNLIKRGAIVKYIASTLPFFLYYLNIIFNKVGINKVIENYLYEQMVIRKAKGLTYDFVIVINGQYLTRRATSTIRENYLNENGKMILYYWDSVKVLKDDQEKWNDFDKILTFDYEDQQDYKNKMSILPLFYINKYWQKDNIDYKEDIVTIGTFRMNRYFWIKKISKENPTLEIKSYLVAKKWLFKFQKLFFKDYKEVCDNELTFKKLSVDDILLRYSTGRAVIDIPKINQSGLTIRTFETIAMHKKLITSNKNVLNEKFYNPDNVFLLSEKSGTLPSKEWFDKPFSIPDSVIQLYSLDSWIDQIVESK